MVIGVCRIIEFDINDNENCIKGELILVCMNRSCNLLTNINSQMSLVVLVYLMLPYELP